MRTQALMGYMLGGVIVIVLSVLSFFMFSTALTIHTWLVFIVMGYAYWLERSCRKYPIGPAVILIKSQKLWESYQRYAHYVHFPTHSLFVSGVLGPFALTSLASSIFRFTQGQYILGVLLLVAFGNLSNLLTRFDPAYLDKNRAVLIPQFEKIWAILRLKRAKENYDRERVEAEKEKNNDLPPPLPQEVRESINEEKRLKELSRNFKTALHNSTEEVKDTFRDTVALVGIFEKNRIDSFPLNTARTAFAKAGMKEGSCDSLISEMHKQSIISLKDGIVSKGPNYTQFLQGLYSV